MRLTCPSCGCSGSFEWFASYSDWSILLVETAKLPSDCGTLALRYVGMFRPLKKQLTPQRGGKLLGEVAAMIEEGISFDRQYIKASSRLWAEVLQIVCDANVQRPLKDHNYLLRVMLNKINAPADAAKEQSAQQRRNDGYVNHGLQPVGAHVALQQSTQKPKDKLLALPVDAAADWLKRAKIDLIENIGMREPIIPALIEQRAMELYTQSKEQQHG